MMVTKPDIVVSSIELVDSLKMSYQSSCEPLVSGNLFAWVLSNFA